MSYPVNEVAKFILSRSSHYDFCIYKLQYLLYIAHGMTMRLEGKTLINENFYVSENGPFEKDTYSRYFVDLKFNFSEEAFLEMFRGHETYLDSKVIFIIESVIGKHKDDNRGWMQRTLCKPTGAWAISLRKGCDIIKNDLIKNEFNII